LLDLVLKKLNLYAWVEYALKFELIRRNRVLQAQEAHVTSSNGADRPNWRGKKLSTTHGQGEQLVG
jgi:hypothetical protein